MLTACGSDPQAASHQSFAAALEVWHAEDPACISLRRQVPIDVLPDREADLKAGLDVMADAGLLATSTITRETEPRFGRLRQAEHVRYEPTGAGAEVIRPSPNRSSAAINCALGASASPRSADTPSQAISAVCA